MLRLILFKIFFLRAFTQHDFDEQGWKEASEFIREGLKETEEPCNDFFEFACGSWNQTEGTDSEDENQRLVLYTDARLLEAIGKIDITDDDTSIYAKRLKTFHQQCTNNKFTNAQIIQQFYQGIERVIGRPPMFIKDKAEKQKVLSRNIWNLLGFIQRELVFGVLFDTAVTTVTSDENQANTELVLLFSPSLHEDKMTQATIMKNIKRVASAVGVKLNATDLKKQTARMIEFSDHLQKYQNKSEIKEAERKAEEAGDEESETIDEEDHVETLNLEELTNRTKNIQWNEFFKGLLSEQQLETWNETNTVFVVKRPSYFEDLAEVVASTDIETIYNFAFWKAVAEMYEAMTSDDKDDEEEEEDRETECLEGVKKYFGPAAMKVLFDYNEWDPILWKTDIEMIGETVFASFKFLIQGSDWLDNEEKVNIMRKVNYISLYSGIPDWINNETVVDQETVAIDPHRPFFENIFTLRRQIFNSELDMMTGLAEPIDNHPDFTNNANYQGMHIEIFLGSVLPPMYHPKYPMSVKYGVLGWTIGHELLHGFDTDNIDEIPPTAAFLIKDTNKVSYARKKACLVKQYASYCFKPQKKCVKGTKTLGENMADIDGLKIAYMAFKFASQTSNEELKLPDLFDYSDDKIFFLAAGRSYCSRDRNLEEIYLGEEPDEHSPNRARVDISVRNFPAFARVFECRAGSRAMPKKTPCSVWGDFNGSPTTSLF